MKIIIGIDPGLKGGVAIKRDGKLVNYCALNIKELYDFANDIRAYFKPGETMAVIEEQTMFRGQGAKSGTTTCVNYGRLIGMFEMAHTQILLVNPKKWQAALLSGQSGADTKAKAMSRCKLLYPEIFKKKTTDGIIDAICIADYGEGMEK